MVQCKVLETEYFEQYKKWLISSSVYGNLIFFSKKSFTISIEFAACFSFNYLYNASLLVWFPATLLKRKLQYKCIPGSFVIFLKTPNSQNLQHNQVVFSDLCAHSSVIIFILVNTRLKTRESKNTELKGQNVGLNYVQINFSENCFFCKMI